MTDDADVQWLNTQSSLDDEILHRLLEPARPTYWRQFGQAIYINLRFARIGQLPSEDSVIALGFWLEPDRLITVRRGKEPALEKAVAVYHKGDGPSTSWELFTFILSSVLERLEESRYALASLVDEVEEQTLTEGDPLPIDQIARLHKRLIYARRRRMPLTGPVRGLATVEGILGQFHVAVLVARFVGLYIVSSQR